MSRIIPPYLQPGDEVAILSPASFPPTENWKQGVEVLENWGLRVRMAPNYMSRHFGLGGTDAERLSDLQQMLDDPSIKAIFPIRGGYGSSRLLDSLDFSGFKTHPKWIVGFSDITALLCEVDRLGFASIHGPMPHNFCQKGGEAALQNLHSLLFEGSTSVSAPSHPLNRLGEASAEIIGGNLSLLCHLIGSPTFASTAGKILFLEEIGERLYHVDRMLLQLKRAGLFQNLSGLIVGGFTDCNEASLTIGKTAFELVAEHTSGTSYPVAFDFPAGHIPNNQPLVFGVKTKLLVNAAGVQLTDI
ncbi:MAG: Muramoyltetrapeptide carboxypeptidase [Bacteroidota bacterium]|jgi:muramoyltetrapeptide carboxypeptidase